MPADDPLRDRVRETARALLCGVLVAITLRATFSLMGRALYEATLGQPVAHWAPALLLVVPAFAPFFAATYLWTRGAARAVHRVLAITAGIVVLLRGYPASMRAEPEWRFHGIETLQPGAAFRDSMPTRPHALYHINAHGFRVPEWREQRPNGVVRIATIGDSFVFGSGVEDEGTLALQLASELRRRHPGASIEVLNLGIPGNNLPSHLAIYQIATETLDADAAVLSFTLPNDLSRWDAQDERRDARRPSLFSLGTYLLGRSAAIALWTAMRVSYAPSPADAALVRDEARRLESMRARGRRPPLLVHAFHGIDSTTFAPMFALRGVEVVPGCADEPGLYIAGDGHPNALGNAAFARCIADALDARVAFDRPRPEVTPAAPEPRR